MIAEILLPFGFGNENFRFLGNMYGGYGNGEYKRYAEGGRFTGDVENYYYGVNNELRGSFDAGFGISCSRQPNLTSPAFTRAALTTAA